MKKHTLNNTLFALLTSLVMALPAQAETVQTTLANLRSEPDRNSRIVATVRQGSHVTILKSQGLYAEVRVTDSGRTGWIYAPAQAWESPSPIMRVPADTRQSDASTEAAPPLSPAAPVAPTSPLPPATPVSRLLPADYDLSGGTAVASDEIRLEMDAQDAEVLFLKNPFDTSSFPIQLRDGTDTLKGEVTVKGSFSRRYLKKSLLITLPKGQTWQGRQRIALNAMATSPAQAREWLTWNLAAALGMTIPQTGYKKLYVNNRYIGLYLDIEWMDDAMFSRLGLAGGEFYQPNDNSFCGDFSPANSARTAVCWQKIFPRDDNMAALKALEQALISVPVEEFDGWLERNFDAQSVIDWLLINTLAQNGDTYNKNYFLHYMPAQQKWRVIPWDYDLAWGRVADNAQPFPQNIHNDYFQYNYPPVVGAENPLKFKTLKNPHLYARFQARLKEVLTPGSTPASGWFEPTRFQRQLADIKALVEPSLAKEAYPAHSKDSVLNYFDALAFFNEWRYHSLKGLLLDPSPFDSPRWLPYTSYDPLTPVTPESLLLRRQQPMDLLANDVLTRPGQKVPFMEKLLAYPLAFVTLREGEPSARITVETDRESVPTSVPPGMNADQCIERTWFVTLKSAQPVSVSLQLDYLQESSTRHELGKRIQDESLVSVWRHDGKTWHQTSSRINPIANYFSVDAQALMPSVVNRYVACQGESR